MNYGLRKLVSCSALLCICLVFMSTSFADTALAHIASKLNGQGQYLGGNHMYRTGYFDLADGGGDYLRSVNKRYQLIFQSDGNLIEYDLNQNKVMWASNTAGSGSLAGNIVKFRTDGNFVILNKQGSVIWATGTNGADPGVVLSVQNSGDIQIRDSAGKVIDTTHGDHPLGLSGNPQGLPGIPLVPGFPSGQPLGSDHMYQTGYFDLASGGGDYLLSQNQQYSLIFQPNGDLEEFSSGVSLSGPIWTSNTAGSGNVAQFQPDGNFVIVDKQGNPIWATGTNGADPGFVLSIQNSGDIQILDKARKVIDTIHDTQKTEQFLFNTIVNSEH